VRDRLLHDTQEFDPYAAIRRALSPEHAHLTADEIRIVFGREPAVIALHWLLASSELQEAALAALLGKAGQLSRAVGRSSGVKVHDPRPPAVRPRGMTEMADYLRPTLAGVCRAGARSNHAGRHA
jgi:hypothetical protein